MPNLKERDASVDPKPEAFRQRYELPHASSLFNKLTLIRAQTIFMMDMLHLNEWTNNRDNTYEHHKNYRCWYNENVHNLSTLFYFSKFESNWRVTRKVWAGFPFKLTSQSTCLSDTIFEVICETECLVRSLLLQRDDYESFLIKSLLAHSSSESSKQLTHIRTC